MVDLIALFCSIALGPNRAETEDEALLGSG